MDLEERRAHRSFAFGPFVLIPERQLLLQSEAPVRIGGRALDILTLLIERQGDVVSKRALMAHVWPNTVVEECNLKVNMAALRRALGDGPGVSRYIATVTGRGYRFVAPVRAGGLPDLASPSFTASTPRHNLPFAKTRIFGRGDAIDGIRRDLEVSRLVTLTGAGGIGKTTVALAVAEQMIGSFSDGIWLVDLAQLKDAKLTSNAISMAIGLPANAADMLPALCEALRDREMLLVLDSCEHIIDAVANCVDRVLAQAARLKVLVTSREPMQLSGERVRRLPGLGTPPPSAALDAEQALAFPAVQLFVDRAVEKLESFKLRDADAPAVAEICRRLDGLALAIEFAATRVDAFGVNGLFNQLDHRFRLLVGRRDGPERHRTLTATLDWSYGLLPADEAGLLRAVSVFTGVFDVEGACAVAGEPFPEVAVALAELVAKSLLAVEVDGEGVTYRLLDTTRSYGLDKLQASGEEPETRQRHAEYVGALLTKAEAEWAQRGSAEWAARYGRLLGDLRSAIDWARHHAAAPELYIRLSVAGMMLWSHFSLTEECRLHVEHAVDGLAEAGLSGTAFEMKLKVWLGGSTMFTQGLRPQALAAMRRALDIAVQLGDTECRLRCLRMIGVHEIWIGEHRAGLRTFEHFAAVVAAHDRSALPEVETNLGIAEVFLGSLPSARQRLEMRQQQDLQDLASDAQVVRFLSNRIVDVGCVLSHAQWLTGSPDTAARTAQTAIATAQRMGHHLSVSNILSWACMVFHWNGAYAQCDRHVALLDEQVRLHGHVVRRPMANFYRAALACERSDASPSTPDGLLQAIEDFQHLHHLARLPYYIAATAAALARFGRVDEAECHIRHAREIVRSTDERWCLPEVLRIQAGISTLQHQTAEAEKLLLESISVAEDMGALSWKLRAATDLARLWRAGAKTNDARALLRPILSAFTEGFETRDLREAAHLVAQLATVSDRGQRGKAAMATALRD